MPELSRFFGIIVRMFYDEHNPPHFHAEYGDKKAVFDFAGNILIGDLKSKTAAKLIQEWADLHAKELQNNWELAEKGNMLNKISPLE